LNSSARPTKRIESVGLALKTSAGAGRRSRRRKSRSSEAPKTIYLYDATHILIGDCMVDLANVVPGSIVGILVILVVVFIIYKIIKVVIPLAVAAGLVLLAWKLGWLNGLLQMLPK